MAEKERSTISLPNTYSSWAKVSENLRKIQEGRVREVHQFEELYPLLEFSRESDADPKFATLRHVLNDAEHITERHFLDTLLPWIARKALEVDELFRSRGHQISVRGGNMMLGECIHN